MRITTKAIRPAKPRAGFAQTVRAVLWSFFGVRRKAAYEKDAAQLNPVAVIIVGLIAAALFVTCADRCRQFRRALIEPDGNRNNG